MSDQFVNGECKKADCKHEEIVPSAGRFFCPECQRIWWPQEIVAWLRQAEQAYAREHAEVERRDESLKELGEVKALASARLHYWQQEARMRTEAEKAAEDATIRAGVARGSSKHWAKEADRLRGSNKSMQAALLEARGVIVQAAANLQGCTSAEIADPLAHAVMAGAVLDIDAALSTTPPPHPEDGQRMCVCTHAKSRHARRGGVLACTVPECACGPGCIHEGFVCADGTSLPDELPDSVPAPLDVEAIRERAERAILAGLREDTLALCAEVLRLRAATATPGATAVGPAKPNVPGARRTFTCEDCGASAIGGPIPDPPALRVFPMPSGWTLRVTPPGYDDEVLCQACSPKPDPTETT